MSHNPQSQSTDDSEDLEVSLIHEAAKRGYVDQIREAITNNPHQGVNSKDKNGNTPLHWAASGGHAATVALLINLGADVKAVNSFGDTALHRAAWKNHAETCKLLVDNKADPTIKNKEGKTALDLARTLPVKLAISPSKSDQDEEYDQDDEDSD